MKRNIITMTDNREAMIYLREQIQKTILCEVPTITTIRGELRVKDKIQKLQRKRIRYRRRWQNYFDRQDYNETSF